MSGFVGFTGSVDHNEVTINTMMDKIIHRGPDGHGTYSDEFISMGFRRLSIIALGDDSQPIHNEDKTIYIMLVGEILN